MAAKRTVLVHKSDNVLTAFSDFSAGEVFSVQLDSGEIAVELVDDIEFGHKIAVRRIEAGRPVVKYGRPIGKATQEIRPGQWVHTHNVDDVYQNK